jgi:DNA-binding IclR family transcriptional regulator
VSAGIQSIEIGMALIILIAEAPGPMTLAKVAEMAGMPRSKAHKYLASFVRCGLVKQAVAGGPYDLGPLALDLGLASMRRLDVIEMGQQALNNLRDQLDTTTSLAIWANRGPTIVRWAETLHISSRSFQLGTVLPVLSSTPGLIFAAFLEERMTQDLIRSELAISDGATARAGLRKMADVDALLAKVRKDGMASGNSVIAMAPGIASIAAPVFENDNRLAAVLVVVGIQGQLDLSRSGKPARILADVCQDLSQRLGAR